MSETTTIRVDRATNEQLKRLAQARRATVAETVARAVQLLRQEQMGDELAAPLSDEEAAWLDAGLGAAERR